MQNQLFIYAVLCMKMACILTGVDYIMSVITYSFLLISCVEEPYESVEVFTLPGVVNVDVAVSLVI